MVDSGGSHGVRVPSQRKQPAAAKLALFFSFMSCKLHVQHKGKYNRREGEGKYMASDISIDGLSALSDGTDVRC